MTPEKLRKMADGYQKKADGYWADYQMDGAARSKSAYDRNTDLAEALYQAADAKQVASSLSCLRYLVLGLDPADNCELKKIQNMIKEGEL